MSIILLYSGENEASLIGERAIVVAFESRKLEKMIVNSTNKSRIEIVNGDLSAIIPTFVEISKIRNAGEQINPLAYRMTNRDILDPQLTPDLDHVSDLANTVLLQMHLDAVGMGALISAVKSRDQYADSRLYVRFLGNYLPSEDKKNNEGLAGTAQYEPLSVLLEINTAEGLYNEIVTKLDYFESTRPQR